MKDQIKRQLQRFVNNQRGIIFLWGMIFIAMAIYTICWFTVGLPLVYFINAIRAQMVGQLDTMGLQVLNFVMYAFELNPVIALIGWLVYGIMHSAKRNVDQQGYYS